MHTARARDIRRRPQGIPATDPERGNSCNVGSSTLNAESLRIWASGRGFKRHLVQVAWRGEADIAVGFLRLDDSEDTFSFARVEAHAHRTRPAHAGGRRVRNSKPRLDPSEEEPPKAAATRAAYAPDQRGERTSRGKRATRSQGRRSDATMDAAVRPQRAQRARPGPSGRSLPR